MFLQETDFRYVKFNYAEMVQETENSKALLRSRGSSMRPQTLTPWYITAHIETFYGKKQVSLQHW